MGVVGASEREIVRRMVYAVADPSLSASIMIRQDACGQA